MKPSSSKITTDHFLLCVFLSLLWGVNDSQSATSTPTPTESTVTTTRLTTPLTTLPTTKAPPDNVRNVTVLTRNESSITLMWDKVDSILTYFLRYNNSGPMEDSISAPAEESSVTHVVTRLTASTKYSFILITASEGVNSTGYSFQDVTAPENVRDVKVSTENETSITLKWDKVNNISTYFLQYDNKEDTISIPHQNPSVTHVVTPLTAGRKYDFTLIAVFEGVNSSGHTFEAVTAPPNADEFKSVDQNETSITLQWKKVEDILDYILAINGYETNVTASAAQEPVTHTILKLTNTTKYDFTLFTVFENVRSSGVNHSAATAPENVRDVEVSTENETSITLKWDKVNNISTYFLQYDNKEDTISVPHQNPSVTHVVTPLTAGRKYDFTLIAVFEGVNSSGHTFEAVTVPHNAKHFKSVGQNTTSITLQWEKVGNILNYSIEFSEGETNVTASEESDNVTKSIPNLRNMSRYDFTLFTVFENVRSSGVNTTAFTAPPNADEFKSVDQNETSITLQWKKVEDILDYILAINGYETNVTASAAQEPATHTILKLTNTTKYDFTLFTVFENVRSSGVNHSAATAPRNADNFKSVDRNETSITLQWKKVEDILDYILAFNGNETNITVSAAKEEATHTILKLTSGTKYDFTLFTVFENVRSRGVNYSAATASKDVGDVEVKAQNETSITLKWYKVNNISTYFLQYDDKEDTISVPHQNPSVTHVVTSLTAGRKYDFTLIAVFEGVNSSGHTFEAVTAPQNIQLQLISVDQNETSITLQWKKVEDIFDYILVFDGNETNITASADREQVTHTIPGLTSGTEYNFSIFTVFVNVRSSGVNYSAVTAPRNTEVLESVGQNETSITLQWKKVDGMLNYTLEFNNTVINVTASQGQENVTHTILGLTSMTEYNITLFTVFENVKSSGVNATAYTAPGNVNNVTVWTQNESSITLMWNKVNNISTYFLRYDYNGNSIEVKGDTFDQEASITHKVSSLNAGTKYDFTLITRFEKVNSTGFSFNAVTVPSMVAYVNESERSLTSITLTWQKENKNWDYFLQINGETSQLPTNRTLDVVSHPITSLQPGTEYQFSVITTFSGLNSTVYEGFTVTTIDCTTWHVTNSSIHGRIEGLFSNATATNKSQTHVSPGGSNVSFTGLYPGATYNVTLVYEKNSKTYNQCSHEETTNPPSLSPKCQYSEAGYSIVILWDKPYGMWTEVEVNMTEKNARVCKNDEDQVKICGLQPARTYEVSLALLSGTVRSSETRVLSCLSDPRGVIGGSVFAVLLFCVLVCVAVFIFLRRPDIISRKKSFIGGSKQSKTKYKAISVAKFPDHFHQLHMDENRGFSEEYESLSPVGTEQTRKAAIAPENKVRNRFNNVLPYDWCRVKLNTSSPNGASDYINASYMPGYNSNREYIASQGPLPSTVNDFWGMIWEQRVKGIVMVTNCTEGGKTKCERYWPADHKPCLYGELLVTIRSEQKEPYWTLREFSVKHRNNSGERTVKQFHFTAWPDHGVPQGTEVLIQFRGLVRRHIERDGGGAPTVVHCSAGVGRTGTIIALDVLLQQLEKERAVGIKGFVHKMRLSRPHMVQTESQYVFLHQSIMDCLKPNEKTEENIYENADMIYANATALQQLR